jgi:hypothetical protein
MKSIRKRTLGYFENLRFPWLLLVTSVLFVVNLFIPDALPFVDEILLGLMGVILSRIKRKRPVSEMD